jgi:hypothetical protein
MAPFGRPLLLYVLLLSLSSALFAFGKAEETAAEPRNGEWVFCVTAFDASSLPLSRRIIGDTLASALTRSLDRVEYRIRPSPEYAWYESAAWAHDRSESGKRLSAKYEERSELLYRGYANWRLRRDIRALDREIADLEEAYRKVDVSAPRIVMEPVFQLQGANTEGIFPPPPAADRELDFCVSQKADAFLSGAVSDYYGRLYLSVRVYARYSLSWIYEDATIFSPEDVDSAMEELASRLAAAIQGTPPAAVRVVAEPADAIIVLKDRYAGRGVTTARAAMPRVSRPEDESAAADVIETAPGTAELTVQAAFHAPRTVTVDLEGGTLTDFTINLTPLGRSLLTVRDVDDAAVYLGALYLGRTPVDTELIAGGAGYFRIEGPGDTWNSTVIPTGMSEGKYGITLRLRPPLPEGRVENSRRRFYGAWGRFWIAMPLSILVNGLAMSVVNAYNVNPYKTNEQLAKANIWYWAAMASDILAIIFAGESIIRAVYYTSTSSRGEPVLERNF